MSRNSLEVANALPILHRRFADTRSSARVSPRSVTRVAAISVTTSSIVAASLTTPPVHDMSPTVRKRTDALNGSSSG